MTTESKLKALFDIIKEIYTIRKNPHPDVCGQYGVQDFLNLHKGRGRTAEQLDELLDMEIEDWQKGLEELRQGRQKY